MYGFKEILTVYFEKSFRHNCKVEPFFTIFNYDGIVIIFLARFVKWHTYFVYNKVLDEWKTCFIRTKDVKESIVGDPVLVKKKNQAEAWTTVNIWYVLFNIIKHCSLYVIWFFDILFILYISVVVWRNNNSSSSKKIPFFRIKNSPIYIYV